MLWHCDWVENVVHHRSGHCNHNNAISFLIFAFVFAFIVLLFLICMHPSMWKKEENTMPMFDEWSRIIHLMLLLVCCVALCQMEIFLIDNNMVALAKIHWIRMRAISLRWTCECAKKQKAKQLTGLSINVYCFCGTNV